MGAKFLNKYGFQIARGSSSRNGTKAIIQARKIMQEKGQTW